MMNRSYVDLIRLPTFEERYEYLQLGGQVGSATFGFARWVNQRFYTSRAWHDIRHAIIRRDMGCDLGVPGYEINSRLLIHHINPIAAEDLHHGSDLLVNMNNLITTTHQTHNAIHYGDASLLPKPPVERERGDTRLW